MRVEPAELEAAIHRHLVSMPAAAQTGLGTLYVKVALENGGDASEDEVRGGLFLSMPYTGADKEWLTKLMAHVREGFDGTEALRVEVGDDEEVSAFDDAEAGKRLLNLLSTLTITPR